VSMKDIHIRRVTGLYMVGYDIWGGQSGIRNRRIRVEVAVSVCFIVEDANDLSCFYHEAPVIVREEGTLTEEVVCVRATGLFA